MEALSGCVIRALVPSKSSVAVAAGCVTDAGYIDGI